MSLNTGEEDLSRRDSAYRVQKAARRNRRGQKNPPAKPARKNRGLAKDGIRIGSRWKEW